MFGANKRLRDLGKDTTDYSNYDSPKSKTQRYREQVYGQKNPTVYVNGKPLDQEASKKVVKIFLVIFFIIFFVPFLEIFALIFGVFDEGIEEFIDEPAHEENVIVDFDSNEPYDRYEEEWVEDYYNELRYNTTMYDGDTLTFIDVDFNGIPEIFYNYVREENNSKIYKSSMYYYVSDDVRTSFVPAAVDVNLYLDTYTNKLVWGSLYEVSSYMGDIRFYRYDKNSNGLAYYTDTDVSKKDEFDKRYSLIYVNNPSGTIYDLKEDYYKVVDLYLDNQEDLEKSFNNHYKS